jgi:uncharacterized protein YcbX
MRVTAIWRYPVKSMAGERLSLAEMTETGLAGDRVVQVYDRRGGWLPRGSSRCSCDCMRRSALTESPGGRPAMALA